MALEQTVDGWRLFVSGIPSLTRVDFSGRRIRYAINLEQSRGHGHPAALEDFAQQVITLLVTGAVEPRALDAVAGPLDEQFGDDAWVVRQRLARDADSAREAERRVLDALARVQPPAGYREAAASQQTSWLGDVREEPDRAAFLSAARALLTGAGKAESLALVLNLISDAADIPLVTRPSVVVLANLAGQDTGQPAPSRVLRQPITRVMPGKAIASRPPQLPGRLAVTTQRLVTPPVRLARRVASLLSRGARHSADLARSRWRRLTRANSSST
jgi:hypothetical protein